MGVQPEVGAQGRPAVADTQGYEAVCEATGNRFSFDARPVRLASGWAHAWCRPCGRQHRVSGLACRRCGLRIPGCSC
eukprot:5764843-Alexandrium_andersonii.AAC.1